jgi:hypothetical protein
MGFFSFLVLLAIAYLLWRVTDQLPDLIFRLSEIQRDVAELRRAQADDAGSRSADQAPPPATATPPAPPAASTAGDDSSL